MPAGSAVSSGQAHRRAKKGAAPLPPVLASTTAEKKNNLPMYSEEIASAASGDARAAACQSPQASGRFAAFTELVGASKRRGGGGASQGILRGWGGLGRGELNQRGIFSKGCDLWAPRAWRVAELGGSPPPPPPLNVFFFFLSLFFTHPGLVFTEVHLLSPEGMETPSFFVGLGLTASRCS